MTTIDQAFIIRQYESGIENYEDFTTRLGLWKSEDFVFKKYLDPSDHILDLGCGTGRVSFSLAKMGYHHILGVDLIPKMVEVARGLNNHFNTRLPFEVGDATNLRFADVSYDAVIFAFNGLMSIPSRINRDLALAEIKRVLRSRGVFIFTTHDRHKESRYVPFWEAEKERWARGRQRPGLFEYGDLINRSRNEKTRIYIHIPTRQEIQEWLETFGFEVLDTFYRSDVFDESSEIRERSGACRFWIARKIS